MKRENDTSIHLGSTADIAFLLLIFFLVVTTIHVDKGLLRKLPEKVINPETPPVKERNLLVVLINSNDELMVEGSPMKMHELREFTMQFLTNPEDSKELPEKKRINIEGFGSCKVHKGIISLQNDRNTSYGKYIEVMNELIAAGNRVKDNFSLHHFGKHYGELNRQEKKIVKQTVPVMISEAEPIAIGQ